MASVVKVEHFDVNNALTTTGTHTLTNTVVMANAFVRKTTSIDKQSGPTASTSNANANVVCGAAYLSSTTQISFRQNSTTSQKYRGEVWRFTGSASDPDEFIVRGRHTISLTATNATGSTAVSGITNRDDCIPFWTGATYTGTSVTDYDSATVAVWIDASNNIQVERGATTGTLVVYVTVVEFVGSNWRVGHGISSSHDTSSQTITLNTASTGTGGSTFNVTDWSKAMIIEGSLEGDTSETGISDNLGCWVPGGSNSQATFVLHQDTGARNDGKAFCHVLDHQGFVINRANDTNWAEGNGADASVAWPSGASTTESIDELSMEWFSDSSGTGTAHARGRVMVEILTSSTAQAWVHRSGNNVRISYGVVELAGVDGTTYIQITDVDTDEIITNTQTNVVITGLGGFEATQGTGKVELVENSDYTGTKVTQTSIDSWADTSIQFDCSAGALANTNCYLFVTANGGGRGSIAIQVGNPPETYSEAVEGLTPAPNHHWPFQNSYADTIGSATANNSSGGTPTFSSTRKLVKGDTHSLQLDSADYISPADQSDMNVTVTAGRRYIGGWVQLDSVHQTLCVLYEEGAQVNNMAILLGFGNIIMVQVADTGDDYAQAYTDVTLTPDRPYHVLLKFHASAYDAEVRCFLDGVLQARGNGNPWTASDLDTHSGNISWGHEGTEQLQVGDSSTTDNTDISFASPNVCNYAHWLNWTDVTLSTTQIRETIFEKGAPAEETIDADTEANMQTDMDALADTEFTDWPCSIEVGDCTAGSFELTMDNITFEERVSMQVRYLGTDTLTLVIENGTVLDTDKLGAPYGGTITVINAVPVTITVKDASTGSVISGAMVLLEEDPGGTDIIKTTTDGSGQVTANYRYSSPQAVTGRVRKGSAPAYKTGNISGTITATGFSTTIFLVGD